MTPVTHPYVRFSAILSYVFVVAVFAVVAWALVVGVHRDSIERNNSVIAQIRDGCNRNMLRNGYSLARPRTPLERAMSDAYFGILDCDATYRTGAIEDSRPVPLPAALKRCWVRLTRELYWKTHPLTTDRATVRRICAARGVV